MLKYLFSFCCSTSLQFSPSDDSSFESIPEGFQIDIVHEKSIGETLWEEGEESFFFFLLFEYKGYQSDEKIEKVKYSDIYTDMDKCYEIEARTIEHIAYDIEYDHSDREEVHERCDDRHDDLEYKKTRKYEKS